MELTTGVHTSTSVNLYKNTELNTHQPLQDPLALVVGAVVRHDAAMDQNQTVQEQPGAEPEQSKHQGPPTRPAPEAQAPEQAGPTAATPATRPRSSREHWAREWSTLNRVRLMEMV